VEDLPIHAVAVALSRDGKWLLARIAGGKRLVVPIGPGPARTFDLGSTSGASDRFDPSNRSFTYVHWDSDVANLWQQDIDGGSPHPLTNSDRGDIYAFDWSPDGKSLAVLEGSPATDAVMISNYH